MLEIHCSLNDLKVYVFSLKAKERERERKRERERLEKRREGWYNSKGSTDWYYILRMAPPFCSASGKTCIRSDTDDVSVIPYPKLLLRQPTFVSAISIHFCRNK
jgi:hypothetical protein